MRGGSNEVTVGERAWVNTCCNKACYMSNVCKRIGAHFFGYSLECLEIKRPCICACTYDYNLRPAFYSQLSHFIVINSPGLTANAVSSLAMKCAQKARRTVWVKITWVGMVHPHDRV